MMRRFSYRFIPVLLVCCLLSGAALALEGSELVVLRIGKADAMLLLSDGYALLIDAGEDEDAAEILDLLHERQIARLDAMIITHFDKDHVGGADDVLEGIPVAAVYDANYQRDSAQYRQYTSALAATGTVRYRVASPQTLTYGAQTVNLLPSTVDTEDDNDLSLCVSANDGLHTYFLAGDAEEARIDELLASGLAPHDVLKLPHHGRWKDNLADLLDALRPSIAIICDSEKNPADEAVLASLAARGIDTYQTQHGDIRILSMPSGVEAIQ